MKVLKFGGSSVGTPERIIGVKTIIESQTASCIVVVSAFYGVTDLLKQTSQHAARRNESYKLFLDEIASRHRGIVCEISADDRKDFILSGIDILFIELGEILKGIYLLRELSRQALDQVLAFGEILSSNIISNLFDDSLYIDARTLIKTDDNFGNANVDFIDSNNLIREAITGEEKLVIIPGFIASTINHETTTLGRGGSDYTAAIIAAAINAEVLEIWTDVDGFMTADPKKVEKAYAIESLSYSEAIELSHFGAKVIYTPSLRPVYKKQVPIVVLNSFNPSLKGTLISNKQADESRSPIKGISSIDHIDLITIQGTAMVGVTGTSMRLFSALAQGNVNVVLITQASSEYSITFAVNPPDTSVASAAIDREFEREIKFNNELKVHIEKDLSIIAVVGEKMRNTPGISATLFRALGRNGINVIATAQGSSELNISVVIRNEDLKKALNVIHDGFFLSRIKEMNLFVAGTGLVGDSLMKQLQKQRDILLTEHSLKINLVGVTNSRKMFIAENALSVENYPEKMESGGENADMNLFIMQMTKLNLRNPVFVDCTADAKVASVYADILTRYVSVVTANKIACSSHYEYYQRLKSIANGKGVRFMFETTVGAGLPIIKTINDLVLSGDKIIRIEAVLSGTLNFIFNNLGPELPLSEAIKMAQEKGFSEPDPRIDLDGTDVVRKILILSREAGYHMEQGDVQVSKILPEWCFGGDLDNFFMKVRELDHEFEQKRQELMKRNRKWRYLAVMDQGKASVELAEVDNTHPAFNLEGSNNIVLLTTERYRELPMVIKGYGAGPEVTAAGLFADLMRVVNV